MKRISFFSMSFVLLLATATPVVALGAGACPGTEISGSTPEEVFKQGYQHAECMWLQARAAGAEWLTTEDILKAAQQAAAAKDWETAAKQVEIARLQAEMGLKQAAQESQAWKARVIR